MVSETTQRMEELQEFSDTAAVASLALNKALHKLDWSTQLVKGKDDELLRCCFVGNHKLKESNFDAHFSRATGIIKFVKNLANLSSNIEKHESLPSSVYAYRESSNVLTVTLDHDIFKQLRIKVPEKEGSSQNHVNWLTTLHNVELVDQWKAIPHHFHHLNATLIPQNILSDYLHKSVALHICHNEGVDLRDIVDAIMGWVSETISAKDFIDRVKQFFMGESASQFALHFWKFVYKEIARYQDNIKTRFGGRGNKWPVLERSSLPTRWSSLHLSAQHRADIYEYVCECSRKSPASSRVTFEDLACETEKQLKVLSSFEDKGEKTHSEVMAELRDYKRRRQSYRGKSKMTGKLSTTETFRELIQQQMVYLSIIRQPSTRSERAPLVRTISNKVPKQNKLVDEAPKQSKLSRDCEVPKQHKHRKRRYSEERERSPSCDRGYKKHRKGGKKKHRR